MNKISDVPHFCRLMLELHQAGFTDPMRELMISERTLVVYLAALGEGEFTYKAIKTATNVADSSIYTAFKKLRKAGLIEFLSYEAGGQGPRAKVWKIVE